MSKSFKEALEFRHACKSFDKNKKISNTDMEFILNAARVSPSSYGLEPSQYIVITNEKLKNQIQEVSMNQSQVSNCSHLVIVLAGINEVKIESGTPRKRFERLNMPTENLEFFLSLYESFSNQHLSNDENIYHWASKQAYLSIGNMMTAAAVKGIDSCPIEGFEKEKVEAVLNLDTSHHQVALVLPFGYRENNQSPLVRQDLSDIVKYIN